MKSPSDLPWWTPLPAPVLWGVAVSLVPLSIPAMAGLMAAAVAYLILSMLTDRRGTPDPT